MQANWSRFGSIPILDQLYIQNDRGRIYVGKTT